jgi:hypothetical protein
MKKPLGCLSRSGLLTALLVLVLLVTVGLVWGGLLFSPGPLNAQAGEEPLGGVHSHAETGGRCSACHVAPWSNETMSDRCMVCHTDVVAQLRDPTSLHGALARSGEVQTCASCHPEHQGNDAPLTALDPDTFPHEVTGYSLEAHRQTADGSAFACTDCHGDDLVHFDPIRCADCHGELDPAAMEAHDRAFGPDCLACHDGIDTYGAPFDHSQTVFPLEGQHATLACAACHRETATIADLQSTPQDCFACHEADDAHEGRYGQDCAVCHTAEGWEQVTIDHDQTAFPLVGLHVNVACEDCHKDNVYQGTPLDCVACHQADDAHEGQFGTDCSACHSPEGWEQATFDHDQTAFPLVGLHANVACEDCHKDSVYQGTPINCFACHEADDAHEGRYGQDCAECHSAEGWEQVTFDHDQTAFPLTGAHLDAACEQCHLNGVYQGTPQDCAACHEDPTFHRGLLGNDCASCHDTAAWSPASYDRLHTFPINHGERGASPCQTCHPDTLSTYTCYGCHEHDRAGTVSEHREGGITDLEDCARCHPTGREEEGGDD